MARGGFQSSQRLYRGYRWHEAMLLYFTTCTKINRWCFSSAAPSILLQGEHDESVQTPFVDRAHRSMGICTVVEQDRFASRRISSRYCATNRLGRGTTGARRRNLVYRRDSSQPRRRATGTGFARRQGSQLCPRDTSPRRSL